MKEMMRVPAGVVVVVVLAGVVSIGCGDKGNSTGAAGTTGSAGAAGGAGTTGSAGATGGAGGTTGSAGTTGGGGVAGTTGAGGSGGATIGCQTSVVPTVALIADFPPMDGGSTVIAGGGVPGGIFSSSSEPTTVPAPSPVVNGSGAWSISNYIAAAGSAPITASFGIYFSPPDEACVDARTYMGVSFKLGGSISGCTLEFLLDDSAHTKSDDPRGSCMAASCAASQKTLTIPTAAAVTQVAWADASGGKPGTAIDPRRLTSIGWQFTIPPKPDGGNGACIVDLTIDDVKFY